MTTTQQPYTLLDWLLHQPDTPVSLDSNIDRIGIVPTDFYANLAIGQLELSLSKIS